MKKSTRVARSAQRARLHVDGKRYVFGSLYGLAFLDDQGRIYTLTDGNEIAERIAFPSNTPTEAAA